MTGVISLGGSSFIHDCCPDSTQNTFVGVDAGSFTADSPIDGIGGDTGTGYQALQALTSGVWNTAIGALSLRANTAGLGNTASGYQALQSNTGGNYNTAAGSGALASNQSGNYNTALGGGALEFTDSGGISNWGEYDSAVGFVAGQTNTTGAFDTFLGANAQPGSGNLFGATAIGACATVSASYTLVLGAPAGGGGSVCSGETPLNTMVGIDVGDPSNILTVLQGGGHAISDGWDVYSSRRWKSDIRPLQGALGKVQHLRGVSYTYTANGKHDIGMIAEEVGKVVPEVVSYEDNGKDARGIDYARLTALLVEAVKQQQAEIGHQQAEINLLKSEVRGLQGRK
ncbi:MAG TPA: tail fiber domain-containing protein [Terriglobia bacterium]|nr:tail fiber domain-containing protein [Terriglobia bacterium]